MCEFSDLKFTGDCLVWAGQRGDHYVTESLDRIMANTARHQLFQPQRTRF